MLDDPSTIEAAENEPVTAIISHVIRSGRTQGYEEWLRGIIAAAKQFDGHTGVSIIQPRDHAHPEYVAILRFDHYSNLRKWMESAVRRDWIERLQPLVENPEAVQTLTGLETWFSLPGKRLKSPPPRYKMFCVTWLGVEIMTILTRLLIAPWFAKLPWLIGLTVGDAIVVACLTYFLMPRLTRLLYPWLYPKSGASHD